MTNNTWLLLRHVFSAFMSVLIVSAILVVIVVKDFATTPGPISDMAGIGIVFGLPLLCIFFILPIILGIAGLSEIGRIYLEDRFKWWITTPMMFLIFLLISYSVVFILGYEEFSSIHELALSLSIGLSLFGLVYWSFLLCSKSIFRKDGRKQNEGYGMQQT